jgi:hypothetical protein
MLNIIILIKMDKLITTYSLLSVMLDIIILIKMD